MKQNKEERRNFKCSLGEARQGLEEWQTSGIVWEVILDGEGVMYREIKMASEHCSVNG